MTNWQARAEAAEAALRNTQDAMKDWKDAAESYEAEAIQLESALREARKWPVELAKVTGLGDNATPEETANLYADNVNQAIAWRNELAEVRELLRRICDGLRKMRDGERDGPSAQHMLEWAEQAVLSPAPAGTAQCDVCGRSVRLPNELCDECKGQAQ